MKTAALSALAALLSSAMPSGAAVIPGDARITREFFGDVLELTESIPPGEGSFAVGIRDAETEGAPGESFLFFYLSIAENVSLYDLPSGTFFTPELAAATAPVLTNTGLFDEWTVPVPESGTLLVSYWDDRTFDGVHDAGDNYGWVELINEGGTLAVVQSATALGGGIVVGGTVQIPEPAAFTLFAPACGALLMRRRR